MYFIVWSFNYTHAVLICEYSFIDSCPAGCGFCLKAPYVTNRLIFHTYPNDLDSVMKHIRTVLKKMFVHKTCFIVPYLILQVISIIVSYKLNDLTNI